jgi:hypothetical protein
LKCGNARDALFAVADLETNYLRRKSDLSGSVLKPRSTD